MGTPTIVPDILYLKTREDLLPYEDSRFNSLMAGVPDCYSPLTDYSVWGSFVRAIAKELARFEYMYSYDLVTVNPQFLTPPDIKRRWAGPLFINKSFPNSTQSDQAYKAMLAALITAYQQGTTVASITDVIEAYTGQTITVEELYREIGNGTVADWQRNTLRVTVPGANANPLSAITAAAWVQTISQDLYSAIDLAKPAHVGLDYSVSFSDSESLTTLIAEITDQFTPTFNDSEPSPLPAVFTQAPMLDPSSPNTELSAWGILAGLYFTQTITTAQYNALMSADFKAEYAPNQSGGYTFIAANSKDVVLVDSNNNPTGAISKAQGTLAPQLNLSWEIKGDSLTIFELT
jgi:hypothetical protein